MNSKFPIQVAFKDFADVAKDLFPTEEPIVSKVYEMKEIKQWTII